MMPMKAWVSDVNGNIRSNDYKQGLASTITNNCGLGKALVVGADNGILVGSMLRLGIDALGVEPTPIAVEHATKQFGDRFVEGAAVDLPFHADEFDTVVLLDCLEFLSPEAVKQALSEAYRVTRRCLFVALPTVKHSAAQLIAQKRNWWEQRCFEAGFRKHPGYYTLVPYELLNTDEERIFILLEKVPSDALMAFPLSSPEDGIGSSLDMSRHTGERSDAHLIRYHWSCAYVNPGDRVLDVGCGRGDGSRIVSHRTRAARIHGVDADDRAVGYAIANFATVDPKLSYAKGGMPGFLQALPEASYDVIFSFGILEQVADPDSVLREFQRILTPGGRVVIGVRNDCNDETESDPNAHTLQVYDWGRLTSEVTTYFLLEDRYRLNAPRSMRERDAAQAAKGGREIRRINELEAVPPASEWCLMTAMKSPISSYRPYEERAFSNIAGTGHNVIRYQDAYENPWLIHAVVNYAFRMKNANTLSDLCDAVIEGTSAAVNDYPAALCVKAYLNLERRADAKHSTALLTLIDSWMLLPLRDATQLRWRVSLLFVAARTQMSLGKFEAALESFEQCYSCDVQEFGIHLSTKITEAFYWAGRLAYSMGSPQEALRHWTNGVEFGDKLLATSIKSIAIDPSFPNLYNSGDGLREYTLAWDYIARCGNGLHLLRIGRMDVALLEGSFSGEYSTVTSDAIRGQAALIDAHQAIADRTDDLVQTRELLIDRTKRLEDAMAKRGRGQAVNIGMAIAEHSKKRDLQLSVVVPCYNEEDGVHELYRRLTAVCRASFHESYELVLVNDGSSDKTWQAMQQLSSADHHVVAINLSRNHGHQLALSAGLQMCCGERIFILDADLQDPPELLPQMVERLDAGCDVVYGQRTTREGETLFKKLSAFAFYRLLNKIVDIDIPRDTGDFRLMSRRALDVLNSMPEHHRFIRGMVSWIGMRQEALPYHRAARFAGETKYPLSKMVRFAVDAITAFSIRPLRFATYLGLCFGVLEIFMIAFVLIEYARGDTIAGWTSLTVIVLAVGSIQLFVAGLMGEYLGRLYMESKGRPLFIIQEIICSDDPAATKEMNGDLENAGIK